MNTAGNTVNEIAPRIARLLRGCPGFVELEVAVPRSRPAVW